MLNVHSQKFLSIHKESGNFFENNLQTKKFYLSLNYQTKQKIKTMENKIVSIKLTEDFKKEILLNSLCNGLGQLQAYGLELIFNDEDYTEAKKSYYKRNNQNSVACYEDILLEILTNGKHLSFLDNETDEIFHLSFELALSNLDKLEVERVIQLIDETDDGETADVVLQTCLFGEIIFG